MVILIVLKSIVLNLKKCYTRLNGSYTQNYIPGNTGRYAHLRIYIEQAGVGVEKGIGIEMGIRVKGNKNKTNTTPNQKGALGDQNNSVRN